MPWEVTIINGTIAHRQPLGNREQVIKALAAAVPGLDLQRPPTPPKELLELMPPAVREAVARPKLEADFEGGEYSIQFYTSDIPKIDWINAEVRGDGDPLPVLQSICSDTGWSVIDVAENAIVDKTTTDAASWTAFRQWRDKGLQQIKAENEKKS